MWWSLAAGIGCDLLVAVIKQVHPTDPNTDEPTWWFFGQQFFQSLSLPAVACFYACAVALLVQNPRYRRWLEPFGSVGRMALTNYLMQSRICTWRFRLTGLYGKIGPAWDLLPTFVIYGLQIPFSVWWLRLYQFGPAEWVWRAFTYGYKPPMRRQDQKPPPQPFVDVVAG